MNNTKKESFIFTSLEKADGSESSIHFSNFLDMGFSTLKEANLWLDSIVNDPYCVDKIFGLSTLFTQEEKQIIINKLSPSKKIAGILSDEDIQALPEYKSLVEKYIQQALYEKKINKSKQTIQTSKDLLSNLKTPEHLIENKHLVQSLESDLSLLKSKGGYRNAYFFLDFFKQHPEFEKTINNILYFILHECETSTTKKLFEKAFSAGQTPLSFCKTTGRDYARGEDFQKKLNDKKHKIAIQKTKLNNKTLEKTKDIEDHITLSDYESHQCKENALSTIKSDIKKGTHDIYNDHDVDRMLDIQRFIRHEIDDNTIPLLPLDKFIEGGTLDNLTRSHGGIGERVGDKIVLDKSSYRELYNQYTKVQRLLLDKNEQELRGFIFDRLVEYITRYFLEYKLQQELLSKKNIKGYSLTKTNILDDTYGGADYMLVIDTGKKREVDFIDAFVANLKITNLNNLETNNDISDAKKKEIQEKQRKAATKKEEYSSYLYIFDQLKQDKFTLPKSSRTISYTNAPLIYAIMCDVFKNPDCLNNISYYFKTSIEPGGSVYKILNLSEAKTKLNLIKQHTLTSQHLIDNLI